MSPTRPCCSTSISLFICWILIIQFVYSAAGHCCVKKIVTLSKGLVCAHILHLMCSFSTVTKCLLFSATISLLSCLHLCSDSCSSLHGEPCTFFLFGWLDPVCARASRHARTRWVIGGFLARFLFSFRAGLWLFDSSQGIHSPLCPPDGCTLGLSDLRTP